MQFPGNQILQRERNAQVCWSYQGCTTVNNLKLVDVEVVDTHTKSICELTVMLSNI